MSDSKGLKTYYEERIYVEGFDMPTFEELNDDQKTNLSLSYGFAVWEVDQKLSEASQTLANEFADKMSGWLDDDWVFWVFVFLVTIGFILLGMTAAFN